ncbi:MAG: phosphatidate cytidylyltransferase [Pyrinomonadaceae bacterium]|nr:phosphatidate cytidylyltransferase [Pyrinomonadaceae bacterium]MCX7639793.1 phosphatidate cytidylyltransferase [Pyrinomonadaceae bacterium]MDW8304376.1 CDP-archaeol synthase [Acidobacteriota bacterium]
MNKRILTALFALPILIFSIILPYLIPQSEYANTLFLIIAAFGLSAGLFEFFSITKKMELKADAPAAYLGATAFFIAFLFDAPKQMPDLLLLVLFIFIAVLLVSQTFRFQKDFSRMLIGTGVTLLGVLYVAFLGGFLVAVSTGFTKSAVSYLSSKLLGYFFLVIMGADTGAYYVGRYLGKRKLAPKISPGKTWEGTIGGILLACLLAAVSSATFFPELSYKVSILLALLMSIIGLFGDLTESAIKRGAKIKDAASILPGHGGFLDRLDSLLFNAPILYYFARFYF